MFTAEFSHDVAADPSTIWPLYAEVKRWPEWDHGAERVELTGAFAAGSRGTMHLKDGQQVEFQLQQVKTGQAFDDVAHLGPNTVRFVHELTRVSDRSTRITHRISIEGPQADELGPAITADVPAALKNLAALAEATPLGFTMVFVRDVQAAKTFMEQAFGFKTRTVSPNGAYCEFEGPTALGLVDAAFAQQSAKGVTLVPGAVSACLGIITADVDTAWQRALTAGAMSVCAPVTKPWGQRVAQVVTPQGIMVELGTAWR